MNEQVHLGPDPFFFARVFSNHSVMLAIANNRSRAVFKTDSIQALSNVDRGLPPHELETAKNLKEKRIIAGTDTPL